MRSYVAGRVLAALTVVAFLVALAGPADQGGSRVAAQQQGQVELSLNVVAASNVACRSAQKPDKCAVSPGSTFTLTVDINAVPASGYSAYELDVVHTGLVSKAIRYAAISELGVTLPTAGVGTEAFRAGALTAIQQPPLPTTGYLGPLVEADFNCAASGTFKISIRVPDTKVKDANGDNVPITTGEQAGAKVADTLLITCVDPLDFDKDGDGCTTRRELGPDERLGGRRDPNNPWDFYDTNGDRRIDAPNDILGVMLRYSANPALPYDPAYDRGPSAGPNAWNTTGPDGRINASNDILSVMFQYQHNCR
ncbi:MAG: hypothetical protein A2148_07675 [Chloroflexi bacterium RBG_16_68_14]|nr:MAG: hypothetical protein A2148_07675 [Chloroflexi bacterium RBG_16_68_14]